MNTLERIRKSMLIGKDIKKENDSEIQNPDLDTETKENIKSENDQKEEQKNEVEGKVDNKDSKTEEEKPNNKTEEIKEDKRISFPINKSNIENSINSLFKYIPFSIPQKNDEKEETKEIEPEIIVLDNTDESLKIYQQKMIDLREENNFLKNQIKEYVSKVAWLEEHFTIRQENANVQHLQELEHIRKANEKETKEYNDKIKELEESIDILQTELTRQTDLLADEKDTLEITTSTNWSLEKKNNELEDKLKIKNTENMDLKAQLINVKEKLNIKTEEYDELEKKYNKLVNESEILKTENEKFKKENTLLSEKSKIYENISKRSSKSIESKYYQNSYSTSTPKLGSSKPSDYSFSLYSPPSTNNNSVNRSQSIELKKDHPSLIKRNNLINSQHSSFIEDTDLNDLIDEISFSNDPSPKKNSFLNSLYDFNAPTEELMTEDNDENSTQPQNILTEINLD